MEKRFCPDCGTEIIGEGAFCPKCGRTLNQPQMQQMPVQQIPMQQIPTQPMPTPAMGMMYIPPRNTKKIWGIVGGCVAAAAVITGIILLIIFSGNPAGEIIKDVVVPAAKEDKTAAKADK